MLRSPLWEYAQVVPHVLPPSRRAFIARITSPALPLTVHIFAAIMGLGHCARPSGEAGEAAAIDDTEARRRAIAELDAALYPLSDVCSPGICAHAHSHDG